MNKRGNVFEDNPDLKRIVFFAFYIVFFVFIVILLRSGLKNNNTSYNRYNSGFNKSFSLKAMKNNNYHFNYILEKNNNKTIFDGTKYNNKEEFLMSGNTSLYYYGEDDNYFVRDNNTLSYTNTVNPIEFSKFLDPSNLDKLFIHGTYISRTEYLSGKEVDYNYEIATSSILRSIDSINADLDDNVNKVVAKVDEDGKLFEIDLDLTNYYKYYDSSIEEYKLVLTYSKYNEITDIKINK